MTKERKKPTVTKPVIDEEAVLRFAEGGAAGQGNGDARQDKGELIPITVPVKRELYAALEREAARKKRTVEEFVRRLLAKHCG
ncbi:ribbon-helix-helix protein, CopG family [Geobacter argillaceus]|uniref:Ribbon-helix-helix CopG family protein n=1 Tax=Geobacter argillaceus TaxID=345631 RepID=A0A562VG13_9BACT|nr:ribbon-helix-helix protein, CopG family [Geobacter argillaceus]TWJ16866.1 ribbon-helix-helix CopG family protein [Geobacter argillaceus]